MNRPARRRWVFFFGLVLLLATLGYAFSRQYADLYPPRPQPRLVVFCLDGLEWSVIDRMLAQGRLPNFARLLARGWPAKLRSSQWSVSPAIWTTLMTGQDPERHGIWDWTAFDAARGVEVPVGSAQRRVPALWNIISEAGRPVAVFNMLATFPGEPINGCIIPYRSYYEDFAGLYPPGLRPELTALGFRVDKHYPDEQDYDALIAYLGNRLDYECRVAEWLLREQPAEVFILYFDVLDHVQHKFWQFHEPDRFAAGWEATPERVAKYGGVIPDFYARVDDMLGRALRLDGLAGTTLAIVSDHGFRAEPARTKSVAINELLRAAGLQQADAAGNIDRAASLAAGYFMGGNRINIELLGPPRTRDMVERVLRSVRYEDGTCPWQVVPPAHFAVAGSDTHSYAFALALDLDTIAYKSVMVAGRRYPAERFIRYHHNSGQHGLDGVLLLVGPDIAPASRQAAHIRDFCPTVLRLLDLPVARDFAGRPLEEAFTEDYRAAHPPRFIAGYAAGGLPDTAAAGGVSPGELRDSLRSLGYLQ